MNTEPTEIETQNSESFETETTHAATDAAEAVVEGDLAVLQEKIDLLSTERNQLQEQVLRTMADFQNFRKRTQAEAGQIRQFATENLVTSLIPVLDNFERTIAHIASGATIESVEGGIKAVERQLRSVLEGQSVVRIISVGQPFDPIIHEALGTEVTSEFPEDTVAIEIEPGYKMGDKVIRPARVKVAKAG